jgi:uncharacterized protein (TIGR02246 family)
MRPTRFMAMIAILCGLLCLAARGMGQGEPKSRTEPQIKARSKVAAKSGESSAAEPAADAAVRESAKRFVANYNKHDAKSAAADFAPMAEFITENGTVIRGREAIERHFAAVFMEAPQAHLELQIESIRLVTSNVAIEEGRVEFVARPRTPAETSRYSALHVYQDGQWWLARTRDFSADAAALSNHERLTELEGLVGEWMEEGEDAFVATNCKWSNNRNYLLQEFTIRIGAASPVTGSTRIGWDPLTRQIKSWTFDSDGGYSEALWTRGLDQWVLKSQGVTHLGRSYSRTSILRHVDQGTLSWESRDRVEGGAVVADRRPVVVKRRPPPPSE